MPASVIKLRGKTRAQSLDGKRRESLSLFMKRGRKVEFVKSGSLFHRTKADKSIETARVIGMRKDAFGIAHVRYEVRIARQHIVASYFEGPRTLALKAFADKYIERLYVD